MRMRLRTKESGFKNRDIAVLAVYRLGGAIRYIHLEDIAIKASELSPQRFAWKKYPDQINLEAVRLALKDEISSVNSRLIGGIREGWMLKPNGLSWCLNIAEDNDHGALLTILQKEADRAKNTVAFTKTLDGRVKEVSIDEVDALLRVNEYSTLRNRTERAMALANIALVDSQMSLVVETLKKHGFYQLEAGK